MESELQVYDNCRQTILDRLAGVEGRITSVRLYLKNIYAVKRFSCATWTSRQHVIAAVSGGGAVGFGECILSVNHPEAGLEEWSENASTLLGLSAGQADRKSVV